MYKLSIIIPCYNAERFMPSTMDMLLKHNLAYCEVMIINDGSTDKTSEIAHAYEKKYDFVKVIDKENEGVSIARNTGIEKASGDFIYFLDSDDKITDGTISYFKECIGKNFDFDFFAFGYRTESNGKILKNFCYEKFSKQKFNKTELLTAFLKKQICFHICGCVFKNEFLSKNKIKFSEGVKIGEDIEFLMKVLGTSEYAYYDSRLSYLYQIRDDSAMQGFKTYSENRFYSFTLFKNCLENNDFGKETERNFFIAYYYVSQLFYYLKSYDKSENINNLFKENKYVLKRKLSGALKYKIAILLIRLLKLDFLFSLKGKK